jgi:vancomycin resistance protein YoaR
VRADSPLFASSARRGRARSALLSAAFLAGAVLLVGVLLGLAFSGSPSKLAEGTHIAGVDVGGMTRGEAVATLERRYRSVSETPVRFVAGNASLELAVDQLAVEPDWGAAVSAAARTNGGFGPLRGFRRLHTRFFGAEVLPPLAVSNAALEFALGKLAADVDRRPRSAALSRRGFRIVLVPERSGQKLDSEDAGEIIVRTLGSFERTTAPVALPVETAEPAVTSEMLAQAARRARVAVSAPVRLVGEERSWRLSRRRIAQILELPRDGATKLVIGGPGADRFFGSLSERVAKSPVDADFAVSGSSVRVVPARAGTELDVPVTARRLLRAATSTRNRVATLVVVRAAPERSTAEARAMGIDRRMGGYKTYNAGDWDRITNLRLGVTYLDGTVVPPNGTFSLNQALGERTVERGFRSAPVIIGTEYEEEVGGGTSQVATTVFNAAWEAGLRITERNPHSLYISRYPLGRDATVYWPSLDLKFVNDTSKWVLVKGFIEADGISVVIYGGESRRVESSAGKMTTTGSAPVTRVDDPKLAKGKTVVDEPGSSPSRTTVTRTIYAANGTLLREETWNTSYKGETRIVRVGTKVAKPKKQPPVETEPPPIVPPTTLPPTRP